MNATQHATPCTRTLSSPSNALIRFGLAAALIVLANAASVASATTAAEVVLVATATKTGATAIPGADDAVQALATINVLSAYDADMRRELTRVARYPNFPEARNRQLTGTVGVEFEIDREGTLKEAGVVKSSQARMLDRAALIAVRHARYQAIPAEALPAATSRRYLVTIEYRLAWAQ